MALLRRPDRHRGDDRFAARDGEVRSGSPAALGRVATALAVPDGATAPKVASAQELKAALLRASALYFPDAALSTAGAHVAAMLDRLGIGAALAPRLRMFANGRTAMRALADAADVEAFGCTQASEIVAPASSWSARCRRCSPLATVYSAAVATVRERRAGRRFIACGGATPRAASRCRLRRRRG